MGTVLIVVVDFSLGSVLVFLLMTSPLALCWCFSLVTLPLDHEGSQSSTLYVNLPLGGEGVSCLHRFYPLVTLPLDDEGSQSVWLLALLVTLPLGSQGQSPSLMVTPLIGHQSLLVILNCLRGKVD